MKTYIFITGSKSGHFYEVELYDESGVKVDSTLMKLSEIDKMTRGQYKLRVDTPWGIYNKKSKYILPVYQPKWMKYLSA